MHHTTWLAATARAGTPNARRGRPSARRSTRQRRGGGARGRQAGAGACAFGDGRRQCPGLPVGVGAEFVPQHRLTARVGRQRRAAVAAQIVQPHHAAVGVFKQRLVGEQALGVGQRQRDPCLRLVLRRQAGEAVGPAAAPLRAAALSRW